MISVFAVYVRKCVFFNNFYNKFFLSSLNICIEYDFEIDYSTQPPMGLRSVKYA